ncbi:MAG: nucleoside hydrolase [Blautia sp.]|nr:nucleoside hydrolase [Blautia sp.]
MKKKRKIIIDCDPGIDDAIALAYAAANPDDFDILAITTVSGNNTIDVVTRNALDLTEFYQMDVPVAKGMAEPLVGEARHAEHYHGKNGLGDCIIPHSTREPVEENAVFYLKNILMNLPEHEKATLVCLAPLTNIAILIKVFPEVKEKIQEILFMGGAFSTGNVTPSAEFNIYADPEAAKVVFKSGIPLTMCGLDVTQKCTLKRSQILKLCQSKNKIATFAGDMAGHTLENTSEKYRGQISVHDVVPIMYMIHPEYFKFTETILDVDCSDGVSRGRTICDFRWWNFEEGQDRDLVLTDADSDKFQQCLIEALFELGDMLQEK